MIQYEVIDTDKKKQVESASSNLKLSFIELSHELVKHFEKSIKLIFYLHIFRSLIQGFTRTAHSPVSLTSGRPSFNGISNEKEKS